MPHQPDIRRYLKHGTLPQLRALEAAARLGSLTRAADELHMAQATASVQIKKLSETVGLARGAVGTTLSRARRKLVEAYHRQEGGRDAAS